MKFNFFNNLIKRPNKNEETEVILKHEVQDEKIKKPKSIKDILDAKQKIEELQEERKEVTKEYRNTTQELKDLGVSFQKENSSQRTETVKDILNPIEEELVSISGAINELRKEYNLKPARIEVLEDRMSRMDEIEKRIINEFSNTELGKKIGYLQDQIESKTKEINNLRKEEGLTPSDEKYKLLSNEINELDKERRYINYSEKEVNTYIKLLERIGRIKADIGFMISKAKSPEYDENGIDMV